MKIFRSVRFNVLLFAVLVAASALGTLLPQRYEVPAKVAQFLASHPGLGPVLDGMGFFNLYHSSWYIALMGLMAFDVIVCKLRAFPKKTHDEDKLSELLIAKSPLKRNFQSPLPLAETAGRIKQNLARKGYALREHREANEVHLWAAKHRLQRWGDFLLHTSIVLILAGALAGSLVGFEEFLPVLEGRDSPMRNRPWQVAVDKFTVKYYPETGTARTFASDLRVVDGGQPVGTKKIVVNDPLDIGGVRFYQASWGMTGMLRSATLEFQGSKGSKMSLLVPTGGRSPIPDTNLFVSADSLLPHFTVDGSSRPDSMGLEPRNPAVLIHFFEGEKQISSLWLLRDHPHIAFQVQPDESLTPVSRPPFRVADFDPVKFSGIQIAYDPGAQWVGYGCVMLLAGLALHFYFHQRRLRLLLTANGGGTHVRAGGWSSRHARDFEAEFQRLLDEF
ncbi:MAG: cytochrome c biogenesis protein ResB [Elusimicrobia bacterium]|nr:cytochrome c biogenesis protein ResB [Elusimicrobiota bacterium]